MTIKELYIKANEAEQKVVAHIADEQWDLAMPQIITREPMTLQEVVRYHIWDDAWIPDVLAGKTKEAVGAVHKHLLKLTTQELQTNFTDFCHLTRVFGQKKWVSNWIPPSNFLRGAHRLPQGRQRGSDFFGRLYLIVFKPNGLLYVCSFQIDEVKAKRLFCIINYRTNCLDGAFQPSEGTITDHFDQTSYW